MASNAAPLSEPGAHFGGWAEKVAGGRRGVMDVSKVYRKFLPAVTALGRNKQRAMYDIASGTTIYQHPQWGIRVLRGELPEGKQDLTQEIYGRGYEEFRRQQGGT